MSTFRNPVGPQPTRVYWRRRLVVLLGIIAAIVLIALIVSPKPDSTTPASAPSSAPAADLEPEPEATDQPEAAGVCDPEEVTVTAIADSNSYAPDETPRLAFSIANVSDVPCTFNVGTTQQVFTVSSGAEQYWSSKDCETDPVDAPLLLEPNVAVTSTPIPWDRTRSAPDTCEGERPAVPSDGATYTLAVAVGEVESEPVSFLLN